MFVVVALAACSSNVDVGDGSVSSDAPAAADVRTRVDAPPDEDGSRPSTDAPSGDAPRADADTDRDAPSCTSPDLVTMLVESADPVPVGEAFEITLSVTNTGAATATGVVGEIAVEGFTTLSGTTCVVALDTPYICPFNTIAAGATRMGRLRGRFDDAGPRTIRGTAYGRELDCNATDNIVLEDTTVTP